MQSSVEVSVYSKNIRLFDKISLTHVCKADSYLEICLFFTKIQTNFQDDIQEFSRQQDYWTILKSIPVRIISVDVVESFLS